jgi:hypothetical protein
MSGIFHPFAHFINLFAQHSLTHYELGKSNRTHLHICLPDLFGTMIYQMCRQRIDLVRDDYYQTEIAYQQQIDRIVHTSQL